MEAAAIRLHRGSRPPRSVSAPVEAMVNTVAITCVVRDDSGQIVDFVVEYINGPGVGTPRRRPTQLVGQRMSELYPAWVDNHMLELLIDVVETGVPSVQTRVPFTDLLDDGAEVRGSSTSRL